MEKASSNQDLSGLESKGLLIGHQGLVILCTFVDSENLLSADENRSIILWDLNENKELVCFKMCILEG